MPSLMVLYPIRVLALGWAVSGPLVGATVLPLWTGTTRVCSRSHAAAVVGRPPVCGSDDRNKHSNDWTVFPLETSLSVLFMPRH